MTKLASAVTIGILVLTMNSAQALPGRKLLRSFAVACFPTLADPIWTIPALANLPENKDTPVWWPDRPERGVSGRSFQVAHLTDMLPLELPASLLNFLSNNENYFRSVVSIGVRYEPAIFFETDGAKPGHAAQSTFFITTRGVVVSLESGVIEFDHDEETRYFQRNELWYIVSSWISPKYFSRKKCVNPEKQDDFVIPFDKFAEVMAILQSEGINFHPVIPTAPFRP